LQFAIFLEKGVEGAGNAQSLALELIESQDKPNYLAVLLQVLPCLVPSGAAEFKVILDHMNKAYQLGPRHAFTRALPTDIEGHAAHAAAPVVKQVIAKVAGPPSKPLPTPKGPKTYASVAAEEVPEAEQKPKPKAKVEEVKKEVKVVKVVPPAEVRPLGSFIWNKVAVVPSLSSSGNVTLNPPVSVADNRHALFVKKLKEKLSVDHGLTLVFKGALCTGAVPMPKQEDDPEEVVSAIVSAETGSEDVDGGKDGEGSSVQLF
jgi:hypothetical protein